MIMTLTKLFLAVLTCAMCLFCVIVPAAAQAVLHELVFSTGDIYKVDTDSGLVTQLTDTDRYSASPTWSPGGTQIAFVETLTNDFYGQYGLFVMNADGSGRVQIAADLVWRSEPVWLNDGETILYATSSEIKGGDCFIKSVKRDGSNAREVFRKSHTQCSVSNLSPGLSPDGTQLVFGLDEKGDGKYFQLYTLALADGQHTKLTDNRANNAAPEWSPDGSQIAFVSNRDKQNEIYVMNADGSNPRRLTHRQGGDYTPHWLPDGQHIIFGSDQDGYNLLSLDVDRGVVRNLTNLVGSSAWNVVIRRMGHKSPMPLALILSPGRIMSRLWCWTVARHARCQM